MGDDMTGAALLESPRANRGTASTMQGRDQLGLEGLLPTAVDTLDTQTHRVLGHLAAIKVVAASMDRPLAFPPSNQTDKAEVTPEQIYSWTDGEATVERPQDIRAWLEAMTYKPTYDGKAA